MSNLSNPLLETSTLPHHAFPFDRLKIEHFLPALHESIAEARVKLDGIRNATELATFQNTILALETCSEKVGQVSAIFFNLLSAESSDELQAMAREISPALAGFSSDILLDASIFQRIKTVWEARTTSGLTGEDLRLTEKTYKDFARNGGLLNEANKEKLRSIDQELSKLTPEFSDNILKATNDFKMMIEKKEDLDGLPDSSIEAAAQAAKEAGFDGKWLFNLNAPSYVPFLTYSARRELREKMWRAYNSRAFRDQYSNETLAKRIAILRHERANLLGYATHAHFVLEERMAETPEKVVAFLERILDKSLPAARRDLDQVRQLKSEMEKGKAVTGGSELMSWDYGYWSEKLKIKLHNFDEEELRPYFKLENVVEGVFEHARQLYGLKFTEVHGIPVYHPEVRTFEVKEESTGKFVGLFYADFFPRPSKRGGAWMTSFVEQGLHGTEILRPHVSIVCNFTKPTQTKPSLLTLDEVRTLFHEFGHSLHGLLSECKYVSLAGTNVFWDFVELPSQIMENWVLEKEGLDLFAVHYQTGQKMPKELTEKIRATAKFQAGWMSMRQLNFGLIDMAWHSQDPSQIGDIDDFEKSMTSRTSLLPRVEGTNLTVGFSHIFAGGYSAGYYSYKWAEVLDADAFEMFKEHGLFNRELAKNFQKYILSRGGTQHPMELYKKFRGREPDPDALLRRDGLI